MDLGRIVGSEYDSKHVVQSSQRAVKIFSKEKMLTHFNVFIQHWRIVLFSRK